MRFRAARVGIAAFAAAWAIGLSGAAVHADEGWTISSFHSQIVIGTDSSLTIQEDITVDFGAQQKHGIFRTIPLRYRYDDTHDRYYALEVVAVSDGVKPLTHTDSIEGDNSVIQIRAPYSLATATHRHANQYNI